MTRTARKPIDTFRPDLGTKEHWIPLTSNGVIVRMIKIHWSPLPKAKSE